MGLAKIIPIPSSQKLGKRKKRNDADNMSSLVASSSNSSSPEAAVSRKQFMEVGPRPKPDRSPSATDSADDVIPCNPPPPQASENAGSDKEVSQNLRHPILPCLVGAIWELSDCANSQIVQNIHIRYNHM